MMNNIVIVGLPGSGKTSLMEKFPNHKPYDDFIYSLCDGNLLHDLRMNIPVVVSDPRLCSIDNFENYIVKNFNTSNTSLILFKNDPTRCKINTLFRNPSKDFTSTINQYASAYVPSHYANYGYDFDIVDVYLLPTDNIT